MTESPQTTCAFSLTFPSSGITILSARSRYLRTVVGERLGPMWSSQTLRSSSTVSERRPVLRALSSLKESDAVTITHFG